MFGGHWLLLLFLLGSPLEQWLECLSETQLLWLLPLLILEHHTSVDILQLIQADLQISWMNLLDLHPPPMDFWYDQRLQSWFPFQFQYQPFLAYNQEKIRQTKLLHWRWHLQFRCDWCGCQTPVHEELSQWPSNSSLVFRYSVKHVDPGAAEGRLLGRQYLPFLASCGVEAVYSKEAFLCCLEKHKGRRKARIVQDLPAKLEFQKDIASWLGMSGYNLVILVFSCQI